MSVQPSGSLISEMNSRFLSVGLLTLKMVVSIALGSVSSNSLVSSGPDINLKVEAALTSEPRLLLSSTPTFFLRRFSAVAVPAAMSYRNPSRHRLPAG